MCGLFGEDQLSNEAQARRYSFASMVSGVGYIILSLLYIGYSMVYETYLLGSLTFTLILMGIITFISVTYLIAGLLLLIGMKMVCQFSVIHLCTNDISVYFSSQPTPTLFKMGKYLSYIFPPTVGFCFISKFLQYFEKYITFILSYISYLQFHVSI